MITIVKTEVLQQENDKNMLTAELRGLSTDTKPEKIGSNEIGNGTLFIEMDTGKIYFYDLQNKQWREF